MNPSREHVETFFKEPPKPKKARKRLPPASPKRLAEAPERKAFREAVIARCGGVCVGPGMGLPGECRSVGGRTELEVHEPDQRSTHPGSHLTSELAVSLCPWHHEYCTDPWGERLKVVAILVRTITIGAEWGED